VEANGIGRYPSEVEAAVYFCCLEALQNVAKYAGATTATITLAATDGQLTFTVADDGAGFDPAATPKGSGLTNMADRLAALGGELEIRSAPGKGTTVRGRVPAGAEGDDGVDGQPAAAAAQASASRSGLNEDLGM
jgi:signal transduction histidine kinase